MVDFTVLDDLCTTAKADGVQQLVVGAVVAEDDAVLLLQRPADDFMGGIFELPSGKVEHGEALDDALRREVAEETGLTVADINEYLGSFDYTSGSGKKTRQFTFAVAVGTTEPVRLTEHDSYQWAPLNGDVPVTDAVSTLLDTYRQLRPPAL
ncbi:NUDIX hydrolase [Salinispora fenicalii]|uniref:NUDIX hydrolase n=1 Tax=Salinispora fenicalii TaxID=1137263 RepID=UPI000481D87D|nr:NUDIX domain-containing protein [Salinispora fenicalii]